MASKKEVKEEVAVKDVEPSKKKEAGPLGHCNCWRSLPTRRQKRKGGKPSPGRLCQGGDPPGCPTERNH